MCVHLRHELFVVPDAQFSHMKLANKLRYHLQRLSACFLCIRWWNKRRRLHILILVLTLSKTCFVAFLRLDL